MAEFKEAASNHLKLDRDDAMVVDFMMAVSACNFLRERGEMLWGHIIGAPGSVKTEILRTLNGHAKTYFLSSLTAHSIISGYETPDGSDPSQLPKWNDHVVVVKEFTTILQLPDAAKQEIFSTLRSCYDGFHAKAFGTKGLVSHKSHFSMVTAVTPAIDRYTLLHADLGERFLAYRVDRYDGMDEAKRDEMNRHVWDVSDNKSVWRAILCEKAHAVLHHLMKLRGSKNKSDNRRLDVAAFTTDQHDQIIELAELLVRIRTVPDFDDTNPQPKMPEKAYRAIQQFKRLACGRCIADDRTEINDTDLQLVRRVAGDTMAPPLYNFMQYMYQDAKKTRLLVHRNPIKIAKRLGYPLEYVVKLAKQYVYSKLLHQEDGNIRLTKNAYDMLNHSKMLST